MREAYVQRFIDGYIDCALWAGLDIGRTDGSGNNPPLDEHYGRADFTDASIERIAAECRAFCATNMADLSYLEDRFPLEAEAAGHDFYLTREHHGAGYWDRYYGKNEDMRAAFLRVSDAAKAEGEVWIDPMPEGLSYGHA